MTKIFSYVPPVRILMACYNGSQHLPSQLASFEAQRFSNWSLDVSDDGSVDSTRDIIRWFSKSTDHSIRVFDGPRGGVAPAFLTLAERAARDAPDHIVAFSDQDDVWSKVKLARAIRWMSSTGDIRKDSLVYASRTILTNQNLEKVGLSHLHSRSPCFSNALVQNVLGGNTIVLSPAAANILSQSVPAALSAGVAYHDWWIYQILSGSGATIFNDPRPSVYYRQHQSNQIGHHSIVRGRLRRIETVTTKNYSRWISANLRALEASQNLLSNDNSNILKSFVDARQAGGVIYANSLKKLGVHRQTPQGDRMIQLMARMGWL